VFRRFFTILFFMLSLSAYSAPARPLQKDLSLNYLVQLPEKPSKESNLVLLLHGYGANEQDLFDLKDSFSKDEYVFSLQAPIALGDDHYEWFDANDSDKAAKDIRASVEKVHRFIGEIRKKYRLRFAKVILLGFSQGATLSLAEGLNYPRSVAGVAALSGRIYPSTETRVRKSETLTGLKVFVGHGESDRRVDFSEALKVQSILKRFGVQLQFHSYPNMDHTIGSEELKDEVKWYRQEFRRGREPP
jgi:phospholipase/carboxylesterase